MLNQRKFVAVMLAIFAPIALLANSSTPLVFKLDSARSSVEAKVAFLGLASKTATFPEMSGRVLISPDQTRKAEIDVTFDAKALRTSDKETTQRLRGEKFFWVEKYPTIRFVGDEFNLKDGKRGTVKGMLTARGVSKPQTLNVVFASPPEAAKPGEPISFSGELKIDRRDYGMRSYQLVVGNTVNITMKARMIPG